MATIQSLQEKVAKAKETVEKRKATIERHKVQLEKKISKGAEQWDIEFKQDDIKGAEKKLKEAEQVLANWEEKLTAEINKEDFLNENAPQVIKDFLEDWKAKVYEWHVRKHRDFQDFKKKIDKKAEEAKLSIGVQPGRMPSKLQRDKLKEMNLDWESVKARKAQFAGVIVLNMDTFRNEEERLAWLEKTLEQEKKFKMLDLIHRINSVVGEITDASYLKIADSGNINGYVVGTKGKADVETITAGGYNIQCFHYRTLVKERK